MKQQHSKVSWAEINGEEAQRLLDDAFAFLGSARLTLRNPTVELLLAVIAELPNHLRRYGHDRVTTFFMGHGAMGRFYLRNGSINVVDEVITKFNALSKLDYRMQHFHYFDCCRVGEYFSFPANCLEGDAAVIYSTQPSQIAYTGEGIRQDIGRGSWTSDGVGVFTREFAILVKKHEGDFEQFARVLCQQTKKKLEQLDPELKTETEKSCRAICHSTNVKKINFKEEREDASKIHHCVFFLMCMYVRVHVYVCAYVCMLTFVFHITVRPRNLQVQLSDDGYIATFKVEQPPPLVVHNKYVVKTHRLQMSLQGCDDWTNIGNKFETTCTPGGPHTSVYRVPIPIKMFGYVAEFRVLADGYTKIHSDSTAIQLPSLGTFLHVLEVPHCTVHVTVCV